MKNKESVCYILYKSWST